MTSNRRRFDNSGLFSKELDESILCLSYDITQKNVYGRGIDNNLFSQLSVAIHDAGKDLERESRNEIRVIREEATVKLVNGLYVPVTDGFYSSDNEHRLNVGLEMQNGEFDLVWSVQDFLTLSKRFIERVGFEVSDELTHRLPINASRCLDNYIQKYLGAA